MVTSICLSSVQIFAGKSERGGGERHRGQGSGHVGPMFRPHRYEKTPGQHEAIRAQKTRYSVTLGQFSHWLSDGACSVAGIFLTIVQTSSEFVGGQCASWRLPPKAAVSAYRRHSFVEGIRNGGLDVTQNRRSTLKIHYGRTKLPALQRFFSFPVLRGRIAWLIQFILALVRLPLSAVKSSRR